MKTHTAFAAVLAAALRDARRQPPKAKTRLKKAIELVVLFRDDNHQFIEYADDDREDV